MRNFLLYYRNCFTKILRGINQASKLEANTDAVLVVGDPLI